MKKVAAIVVTYNRCELLLECIDALRKYALYADIIVINNASTDETEKRLEDYINRQDIMYYNTGKNIGGAGGFNYGMKKAYALGYEYFWLMDDDTIVQEDSLNEIIRCVNKLGNNWGFISSKAVWMDGSECKMNRHKIRKRDLKQPNDISMILVTQATFVSFFTHRSIVEKVGYPIKDYFIWGDDTEYSLRISQNYPSYYAPNSKVIHKMKENKSTAKFYEVSDKERIDRLSYSIRNDVCTYKRRSIWELLNVSLYFAINILLVIIKRNPNKWLKIKVVVKAYFYGLIYFNPEIEMQNEGGI